MGKVLKKSANPGFFAQGGKTHMFGKGGADEAPSGQSAPTSKPGPGAKFAAGGKGHMFGKGHANEMTPGQSAKSSQ
jgi:hypothetical protein